jgi:alcohol dehydrogenase class IV
MRFEFATATRILFGAGSLAELEAIARPLGKRALLVSGRAIARAEPAREQLTRAGVAAVPFSIAHEPTVEDVRQGTSRARQEDCAFVVAMGGGSVIDAGKAIAGLLGNGGDPMDYLEVVGRKQPLTRTAAPWVAIPTTAGTGAEVTRNAVLASPEHKLKASLRSPLLLAHAAIVDPDLLSGLPPAVIAASGLDAFAQLVEPFVSTRANPMIDALCREGLARSARSLRRGFEGDLAADVREDLALASLFGGLALANAGLGAVHGLAAPIGGMFDAPHGAVCAALLPEVMEANVRALSARAPESEALVRHRTIAALVTGKPEAAAQDGVAWVRALARSLSVAGLSRFGVSQGDIASLVSKARQASSMRANPVELTEDELAGILRAAL